MTTQHQVDLFFALVMVGKVGAAGRNFHEKEAGQNMAGSHAVPLAIDIPHQQPVESRRWVAT